ncbi:MAG: pyrroline-5-carboxylate reductase, partial [Candidatus Omnitrophica bacterium]|nr:pyrroline-5-carboxylate reductase [Candidatus Omnitrophota bacterium]
MKTLGLIGGGNMGEALIVGAKNKFKVLVYEVNPDRQKYLKNKYKVACVDLNKLVISSEFIVLAIKPQDFPPVLDQLAGHDLKKKVVISIAAGITVSFIEQRLIQKAKVVRTMPNMPALIGEGITAVCKGKYATLADLKQVCTILAGIGQTLIVKEDMMDAITAVSGSGPAYIFLFVECMIRASQNLGLTAAQSKDLVYQTLTGSAHLLGKSQDDAMALRAKVTSRGGTTQAATD